MAIKGSLKEASLPDVLQLLALGRKTGCLAVADRHNFGYIYFDLGKICYASIVNRRDRLGDILVKNNRISAAQLQQAVDLQTEKRETKLGQILVEINAISREELEEYMRLQIEEAVFFLFTWNSGTFNFEAGVRPEREDFLVQINPESLLLEGARRVDEWSLIEKKIPAMDIIFALDRDHLDQSEVRLSPAQERILPLLDGSRDVQQVFEDSGLIEFEAGKALFGLITAGFAHRVGSSVGAAAPAPATEGRIEEHRNLGIAFYKTGMLDEAMREFRRVAELKPREPSSAFYLGLIALKQARWPEAVASLRQAAEIGGSRPQVMHNLGFALEQMGRLDEAEAAYADAVTRARDDARYMLSWGIAALKRGDSSVAVARLARARELWADRSPPPTWYWAVSLAAAGADDLAGAVKTAQEGVAAHPTNAVLRNNLSVLFELSGDLAGAEVMARSAFSEEPTYSQISKNLGDLMYRAGRYDEALDAYERAAKLNPDLGDDLYFKMGNIAFRRRDQDRARACWQRATALNPGHQLARTNLDTLGTSAQ
jgi:tetratricopeptide (TPR) repeat protein